MEPKRRPWWVPLVVGGISTGVGIAVTLLTTFGVSGPPARAEPRVTTAGISLPPGAISLDDRLKGIEQTQKAMETTLNHLVTEMDEVKLRLPQRP